MILFHACKIFTLRQALRTVLPDGSLPPIALRIICDERKRPFPSPRRDSKMNACTPDDRILTAGRPFDQRRGAAFRARCWC